MPTRAQMQRASDLRHLLRALVSEHDVGEKLPGERGLAERFGVARMTVRRELRVLESEGVVRRVQGVGSFVSTRHERVLALTSFTQDMRQRGLVPGSRLLTFETVTADEQVRHHLRLCGGSRVFRFTRLRFADEEPIAVEVVWIPESRVSGLDASDLNESLYDTLFRRWGITVDRARVAIESVFPSVYLESLLQLRPAQACLRMRMVDFDRHDAPVMLAHCVYRGDRYVLTAELRNGTSPPGDDLTTHTD